MNHTQTAFNYLIGITGTATAGILQSADKWATILAGTATAAYMATQTVISIIKIRRHEKQNPSINP